MSQTAMRKSLLNTDVQVIDELRKEGHKVRTICQTLQVPVSSYYRCCKPQEDRVQKAESAEDVSLVEEIKAIKLGRPAWGYRRVTARLRKALGRGINRKRVHRLMKLHDLLADVKQWGQEDGLGGGSRLEPLGYV